MEIKGYITNLADYNAGRLNGEWLTFPADEEEIDAALDVFGIDDVLNSSPDDYFFAPGIDTDEDLGYYYADACCISEGNTSDTLERYFDYEAYGRDIRLETNGDFTAYGWIERI